MSHYRLVFILKKCIFQLHLNSYSPYLRNAELNFPVIAEELWWYQNGTWSLEISGILSAYYTRLTLVSDQRSSCSVWVNHQEVRCIFPPFPDNEAYCIYFLLFLFLHPKLQKSLLCYSSEPCYFTILSLNSNVPNWLYTFCSDMPCDV